MSDDENDESSIAPSFEEQIKHLRRFRSSRASLVQKTTEHNVMQKLVRELDSKTKSGFNDAQKDLRLEQTLNRETQVDVFNLFDSLSAQLTGYTRRSTKTFSAPPAPRPNRTTRQHIQPQAQPTANPSLPQNEQDMLVGKAKEQPPAAPDQDQESTDPNLIVGKASIPGSAADLQSPASASNIAKTEQENPATPAANPSTQIAEPLASIPTVPQTLPNPNPMPAIDLQTEFFQKMGIFSEATGLDLLMTADSTMQIHLTAGGISQNLHAVSLNSDGLAEAHLLYEKLSAHYMSCLRDDFGIEFGHPGEIALHQTEMDSKGRMVQGKPLFVRSPRIDELKAAHAALEYSWPSSAQQEDQLAMRFLFINDVLMRGDYAGIRLKFMEDGRPVVFITPALCLQGAPTDRDQIPQGEESWQRIIMRELAWKTLADCQRLPLSVDDCRDIGWIECKQLDGRPALGVNFFCTRDGEYYFPNPDPASPEQAWLRVSKNGDFLNKSGNKAANPPEVFCLSAEKLAAKAHVVPVGLFHSPEEELADALTYFRSGVSEKGNLLQMSPQLYRLVKSVDQECINRWYIPDRHFAGFIRSPNGELSENDDNNREQVLQFEQECRRPSARLSQ